MSIRDTVSYYTYWIALVGAIFFPYMPVVHGVPITTEVHHCGSIDQAHGTSEKHSMQSCIDAIHDVRSLTPYISLIDIAEHTNAYTYPDLDVIPIDWGSEPLSLHLCDPPSWGPPDLVGIIRLTT